MLVGPKITIRAVAENDLESLLELLSDDEVAKHYYAELCLPLSLGDVRQRFLTPDPAFDRFAIATHEGRLIGICGVGWQSPSFQYHRTARISLLVSKSEQHRGYGFEARLLLCDRLFSQLNAHRIVGGYLSLNRASARQAERTGALTCGQLRQAWYFDGTFHDITAWCLTPERFYAACRVDLDSIFNATK
jgi:RimJ/RimL family protein N-acetyltransferase